MQQLFNEPSILIGLAFLVMYVPLIIASYTMEKKSQKQNRNNNLKRSFRK